jgi:hypothetical protein
MKSLHKILKKFKNIQTVFLSMYITLRIKIQLMN